MSDLQNPIFDEEKEFLERKKLEYERALRGDVDHIKDQSVRAGKVALVGAGLAGGIWLITKAFSGKKRKPKRDAQAPTAPEPAKRDYNAAADGHDDEPGATYFTSGNGKRYKSAPAQHSAAASASAFIQHEEQNREGDDLGFGSKATAGAPPVVATPSYETDAFDHEEFEDDPFRDLAYDDSRRLAPSHAFDDNAQAPRFSGSSSRMVGSVLQAFMQSDTGKMLIAQAAAVALALVTKKVSEFFPPAKNPDLATAPGYAPAETGFSPVSPSAPSAPSDALTHPQSLI